MTNYELWEYLYHFGQIANSWWYSVALLPAVIISGCTYLLMLLALRRERRLPIVFCWLLLSSVPLILVLPSFYVGNSLPAALDRIGFPTPASAQQFPRAAALKIGQYLSGIATLGIIGISLSIVLIFAGILIGGYAPQQMVESVRQMSQNFTKAMTRAFGERNKAAKSVTNTRNGIVKVVRGQQQNMQFGIIDNAIVGKQDATIVLTDDIVSRRHARFEIRHDRAFLLDHGSTNGTFVQRNGNLQELNGDAFQLEHGDHIFLGDPGEPEHVELAFEKPYGGS